MPGAQSGPSRHTVGQICAALEMQYHSPRHGNKANPLDELVYIILSTRTGESVYEESYRRLKGLYASWSSVRAGDFRLIMRAIHQGGLAAIKARQLMAIMRSLSRSFGRATLAPLRYLPTGEAEEFLTSLPGVGPKVAKCVLMYSLERQVLPVDVHVHRIASRLGFLVKKRPDTSQELIERAVPPKLRYGFHVNSVAHGREVCLPRSPRCQCCCLASHCAYFSTRR